MKLTERRKKMLAFIAEFVEENNYPPSIRDIGSACDISSTSVVKYNLTKLEQDRLIKRDKEVSRGLSLDWAGLQEAGLADDLAGAPASHQGGDGSAFSFFQVPVLGYIAAGEPIQVETTDHFTADEWLELNETLYRNPDQLYALRVQGDSMIDASVLDGDIVILRHQERAENGEMVAAWIDTQNETTLKHFFLEGDQVRLRPANPSYPEMFLPAADVSVKGKVVSVIRQLE
ncbi:MAG: transcriptional repressor LexA [Caldilineaceae bacterium SB0661_bin_32]|uniref:LexA repressor n=1 Tax=Caldilineaceae bacterium SB0661_bin_32 TaxID=2605255 RepID=A0A6B1D811_9CHLR|nr:transcriptional repressor LexA [Caldilineaceae bacterium SB0661_bin_32]